MEFMPQGDPVAEVARRPRNSHKIRHACQLKDLRQGTVLAVPGCKRQNRPSAAEGSTLIDETPTTNREGTTSVVPQAGEKRRALAPEALTIRRTVFKFCTTQ